MADSSFKKVAPAHSAPQKISVLGSPQKKVTTPAAQSSNVEVVKESFSNKQTSPAPGEKTVLESRKVGHQYQPEPKIQAALKQGNAATQQESDFFGFGGSKNKTSATKPADSVTGKMYGFGSSIFSSASSLISSSVQDEPKTTPQVSPKLSGVKDSKYPIAKKPDQEKKTAQLQQNKSSPSAHPKGDKPPMEHPQNASAFSIISKVEQSTCPLCKLELNIGSKDPPNYNTCTMCKNTVCNQCGFNPMPNVTEVRY